MQTMLPKGVMTLHVIDVTCANNVTYASNVTYAGDVTYMSNITYTGDVTYPCDVTYTYGQCYICEDLSKLQNKHHTNRHKRRQVLFHSQSERNYLFIG